MYALLVAEDADEGAILSVVLRRAGLAVNAVSGMETAMKNWSERPADIILLAVGSLSPQDQVRSVRAETEAPLILVTSAFSEELQSQLLKTGADLIVQRPFSARLLIAQTEALLRRAGGVPLFSLPNLNLAGLTLDPATRTVEVADHPSRRLTHLEFRLLYTLMTHRGHVLPTETIVERVWGYSGEGSRELVRGLISRLRAKVEPDPRRPQYILTVPGVGYSFNQEE
jgi:DNA-binding response OmpR family regulator